MLKTLAALALLGFATLPALAQSDAETDAAIKRVLGEPAAYREAFDVLQAAVADDNAAAFAEYVSYPIDVVADGEEMRIETPEQFAEHYHQIVTDEIGAAITDQDWATIFVNQQGVMFGDGQVWLNGICEDEGCEQFDVRIITIQSTAQ